ncbi:MAG TPA: ATP-binding protein [Ktedonobacteraceae bacterium]
MDRFVPEQIPTKGDPLFANGGEMGRLLQEQDWAATPLGPVVTWPQSLRTSIGICLSSGFPMLVLWGPEQVQFYNDAFRPILGDKHPRSVGQRGVECWAEIWNIISPLFASILAGGEAIIAEDQPFLLNRSGELEEAFFTFSYSPIPDEARNVGGIFCTVKETTRQVLSERRTRTLRELAAHTTAVHTTTAACQKTLEVLAVHHTDSPCSLLYLLATDGTHADLMGTAGMPPETLNDLCQIALEGEGEYERAFARVSQTKQPLIIENHSPLSATALLPRKALLLPLTRAGEESALAGFLLMGIHPSHPLDEEYRGFFELVATQIAATLANARAHEEEQQRIETLAALDRAKTVFFHNISHEFRTPLTLSLGPLEQVLSDRAHPLDEEQQTQIALAHRNILRQLKLVNTLLDFARLEAGRAKASYQPTDLAQATTELTSAFQSAIEQAGLAFLVDCPPLPELIAVDREMWEKIVLNLLSNAFKFTLAGTIRVSLHPVEEGVELQVQDTGGGIRAADVPHLFERFYRAQVTQARTQEGSGIGLALVQELVHLHGGSITVTSQEGLGSTFTVHLPTGVGHLPEERVEQAVSLTAEVRGAGAYVEEALRWLPADLPSKRREEAVTMLATPSIQEHEGSTVDRSGCVLVVDDNADMRAYLARLLRPLYQVALAADGSAALEMIDVTRPDVILSDVMMPGLDGFALLETLRATPTTASMPVILLSARAGEEATLEALREGANDYLVKPFSAGEVLARVRLWVEIVRLRKEAEQARQHLHDLLMQAPASICVLRGPDHIFEMANPLYYQLVGARELLGKPLREALPELEGQGFYEVLDQVYRSGEPFLAIEARAELHQRDSQPLEEKYVNVVYQPIYSVTEVVEGIMVHAVDVTEQVRARQQMQAFLGIASHELKNPLTSIKGNVEIAQRRLRTALQQVPAEARALRELLEGIAKTLTRTNQQIDFQNRLVSDLVDATRIQEGKLELRREQANIQAIILDAVEEQRRLRPTRTIHLDLPEETLFLLVDADRIGQVVINYLSNALKYSDADQEVAVRLEATEQEIQILVRDQGPGLSQEAQEHIWERFYRAPGVEVKSGTGIGLGLGLYICRTIVEQHGGSVGVKSIEKGGSTFWLTLPRHTQTAHLTL